MTITQIKKWIAKEFKKGGNDFINWQEIKEKVTTEQYNLIVAIIGALNKRIIFKTPASTLQHEIKFACNLLKKSGITV
ncbi:MAG: hypothetical protein WC123_07580 [Bacilli bacterium]